MQVSKRIEKFSFSPIRKLTPYANNAKKKGIKVYHLNIGQPDINTPDIAFEAMRNYNKKLIPYGPSEGILSLRESLVSYYKNFNIDVTPDDILITVGGSEALLFAFTAICEPGDQVIVPEPFYSNYSSFAGLTQVDIVPETSYMEKNFELPSIEYLAKSITEKTKAILLCNPNNPTGYIFEKEELLAILKLCKDRNLFLIVDEVYREFCYDGKSFNSVLSFPEYSDLVVCIDSFSKRFSMCGARIGAIVSKNKDLILNILKLGQARLCPPTIEQIIADEALKAPNSYVLEVVDEYERRRNTLLEELAKIPGVKFNVPKGAFYLVAELPVEDATDFARFMLEDFSFNGETTMVAPAEGFYRTPGLGKNQVRIAYVLNENDIRRAIRCLAEGLKAYLL